MKKLSIVIPVYYNEESLPDLFHELCKVEEQLLVRDIALELIFVDDGSGDHSLQELLKIKEQRPSTKIIKLARNFGAIHAVKTGLQFVSGDCFSMLAADLQDPPELLIEMADKWLAGDKFIICVRESRQDPLVSKMFARLYYRILRWAVVPDYPAGGFDLALMDSLLLPHLQQSGKNINISLFAYWLGFQPEKIYYQRRERKHGKSRWTMAKKVTYLLDSILGFSVVPIRLVSITGGLVAVLSFVYGMVVVGDAFLHHIPVPGFATLAALISFLLGLVIIMLGVIGEYLWRIFDEVNKRPEYVIDEIH
ncbi:MAG TPA: glycosyltransferase family 2 protein [Syntrophomonadaceae bacterium]|nr:glycosyltransferase family 2 protein [Syntrophomonadaceae bacterium]